MLGISGISGVEKAFEDELAIKNWVPKQRITQLVCL